MAYDLDRQAWRNFRLDRVSSMTPDGRRFRPRELPAEVAAAFVRQSISAAPMNYDIRAVLHCPAALAQVRLGPWADLQELPGDRCQLTIPTGSLEWAAMAIGSVSAEVSDVRPPSLVSLLRQWSERFAGPVRSQRTSTTSAVLSGACEPRLWAGPDEFWSPAKSMTVMTTTHILETAEVDLAYDVHGPLPTADGRPPLFMIGQPMNASGFHTLAALFADRTVITYDPRGLGRSRRKDGRGDQTPAVQADDVHAVIEALGVGPVEMFASSGGAVTALALVAAHPYDVTTLVAHEPPLIPVVPDAEAAERARAGVRDVYEAKGSNAGMAAFIAMTSWRGEYTDEYFAQPAPDPALFGMPTEDDGSRDDPLLSDRSWAISSYRPAVDALTATPTRIVIAVGEESQGIFTGRTSVATAELLGQQATVFPSHHGGFNGGESGYAGQPEAFARRLRDVLDSS